MRSKDGNGYGKLKVPGGYTVRAHRFAYFLANGTDPGELMVCHRCDNPPCCNPAHLFLGTNQDNQRDCESKGRRAKRDQSGPKNGNAKLTPEQVEAIRGLIRLGWNNSRIARSYGVTHQLISRIRRGRAWGSEPMQPKYASLRRHAG